MPNQRLVLLGDSILDNAPYTNPEPDTAAHLQRLLPSWYVQRLAQDGAVMSSVRLQLAELKSRPAIVVLSIGGNDAVQHIGLLEQRQASSTDVLDQLVAIGDDFARRYESVVRSVAAESDRLVLCTIYEVQLEPSRHARLARVPLAVLNDRIVRTASRLGVDVLDLRTVCAETSDFVLQIEPSAQGAAKIARAIAGLVNLGDGLTSGAVFSA